MWEGLVVKESLAPEVVPSLSWQVRLQRAVHPGPLQMGGGLTTLLCGAAALVGPELMAELTACISPKLGRGDDCHTTLAITDIGSLALL